MDFSEVPNKLGKGLRNRPMDLHAVLLGTNPAVSGLIRPFLDFDGLLELTPWGVDN